MAPIWGGYYQALPNSKIYPFLLEGLEELHPEGEQIMRKHKKTNWWYMGSNFIIFVKNKLTTITKIDLTVLHFIS